MTGLAARWRKDALALAAISAPFAALIGGLLVMGEFAGGGWAALDYLVYALAAGALWAAVVVGCLVWVVIRDGWQASSAPAIAMLVTLTLLTAGWGYLEYADEVECRAAYRLYDTLASIPAADRSAAIQAGIRHVRDPSPCALDGLIVTFGRDPAPPPGGPRISDRKRLAVLAELLQAGLPPDDRLLYSYALDDGDAEATRLLLHRRKALNEVAGVNWDLFPDDLIQPLIARALPAIGTRPDDTALRAKATLEVFVDTALPDPSILTDWAAQQLTRLGLLP